MATVMPGLGGTTLLRAQEAPVKWEVVQKKLKASRISIQGNLKYRPLYGFPVRIADGGTTFNLYCKDDFGERIMLRGRDWISENLDLKALNWLSSNEGTLTDSIISVEGFSITEAASGVGFEGVSGGVTESASGVASGAISRLADVAAVIAQWEAERPAGKIQVVCGPMEGAVWVAICKKTNTAAGFKSIAFILPVMSAMSATQPMPVTPASSANATAPADIFVLSESVNILEYKCGYDLFCELPRSVQEAVENMTAVELFCPFVEEEADFLLEESLEPEPPDQDLFPDLDYDGF